MELQNHGLENLKRIGKADRKSWELLLVPLNAATKALQKIS